MIRRTWKSSSNGAAAPFYTLGPLTTDIAPGYDPHHLRHRRGHDRWYGTAMLCYVTPKEHLGLPNKTTCAGVVTYKSPPAADRQGPPRRADRDNALSKARYRIPLGGPVQPGTRPRSAPKLHDETLQRRARIAHFCSMCGPNSAPWRSPQQVRDYAAKLGLPDDSAAIEEGMQAKTRSSRKRERDLHVGGRFRRVNSDRLSGFHPERPEPGTAT